MTPNGVDFPFFQPALPVQTNGAVRPIIRKKAALCLLRLLRKAGPDSDMLAPEAWSVKLVSPAIRNSSSMRASAIKPFDAQGGAASL